MKQATSEAITTTKAQLADLERQAIQEQIQELTAKGREAKKLAKNAQEEFYANEKKFFVLEGEFDAAERTCARLYSAMLEFQREQKHFPTEEEALRSNAEIAKLQAKLDAAREQRTTTKNKREAARDAALRANAEHQNAVTVLKRLEEAIEGLRSKIAPRVVGLTGFYRS